ncbi:MAG: hypothetical protein QQN63_01945 [Nitrosopumilus sp.]
MPFSKETAKDAGEKGSRVGVPNKLTQNRRKWIAKLLNTQERNIANTLKKLYEDNPIQYMNAILQLLEFDTPKLARTEITGKDGEAFAINVLQIGEDGEQTKLLKAV